MVKNRDFSYPLHSTPLLRVLVEILPSRSVWKKNYSGGATWR